MSFILCAVDGWECQEIPPLTMSKTLIDGVSPAGCHAVCSGILLWPSTCQVRLDIAGRGGVKDGGLVVELEGCCSTDSFDDIFHDSMIWF